MWEWWWSADMVDKFENDLMLQILAFFKSAAYFVAIMMIVYYWFNVMKAFEKEDKIKEWRKWVINVIIALIFIKIIDFVFYIAQQSSFTQQAWNFIIWYNKIMMYILWWFFLLYVIYAWVLLVTSYWEDESWKKAKTILINILLIWIIVALFLLILQQILKEIYVY
jgi:hypothetical protein